LRRSSSSSSAPPDDFGGLGGLDVLDLAGLPALIGVSAELCFAKSLRTAKRFISAEINFLRFCVVQASRLAGQLAGFG